MSIDTAVTLPEAKQLLRAALARFLADREWRELEDLYFLIQDPWAEALIANRPEGVWKDIGWDDYLQQVARPALLRDVLDELVKQRKCEINDEGTDQEVRWIGPVPAAAMNNSSTNNVKHAALLPKKAAPSTTGAALESAPVASPQPTPTLEPSPVVDAEVETHGQGPGAVREGVTPPSSTGSSEDSANAEHEDLGEPQPSEDDSDLKDDEPDMARGTNNATVEPEEPEDKSGPISTQDATPQAQAKTIQIGGHTIVLDPEFAGFLGAQTDEEARQLDDNLEKDEKVLAPLILWEGPNILLDGYNRLARLLRKERPFRVEYIKLSDREAAKTWIYNHQLGQRNVTPERVAYLRGKLYEQEKRSHGGHRRPTEIASAQKEQLTTADKLGAQFGVSRSTIRRDAEFAKQVDQLVQNVGPEVKTLALAKNPVLDHKQVAELAQLDPKDQPQAVQNARVAAKTNRNAGKKKTDGVKQGKAHTATAMSTKNLLQLSLTDTASKRRH